MAADATATPTRRHRQDSADPASRIERMQAASPSSRSITTLISSKALRLSTARSQRAATATTRTSSQLYEFKTGEGAIAYDTSGVEPALNLTLRRDRLGLGRRLGHQHRRAARPRVTTGASRKLRDLITLTGEYSIEAWVAPGNVAQEECAIVSYSGSATSRNFTLGQTLYSYDFYARSSSTNANGDPHPHDRRRRRGPAGDAAARRRDVRSGQRPPHLRERRVHWRRRSRERRHARRVGRHVRLRPRQRGERTTVSSRARSASSRSTIAR